MTSPTPDDRNKVVVLSLTARKLEDAPLVFVGGHPVPAERVSFELVPDPAELRQYGTALLERGPQRKAVLTLVADPDDVTGHAQVTARPARPHSEPLVGPDGYADADPANRTTLMLERSERGICLAVHNDHHGLRVEVDAREVHALAAELVAVLSRPAP